MGTALFVPTIHPRSAWESAAYPVHGGALFPWSRVTHQAVHYTADDDLIDGDPGEHAEDLPGYIRAIQRDYVTHRGYSVGYNWAVDWLGGIWTLRGWDFQCAANLGANAYTFAVLMLVDGADPATPEATRAARWLGQEFRRRTGRTPIVQGHNELDGRATPTGCPGAGILAQLHAGPNGGEFSPDWLDVEPLPPIIPLPPDPEEDDVTGRLLQVNDRDPAVLVRFGNEVSWAVSLDAIRAGQNAGHIEPLEDLSQIAKVSRAALLTLAWVGPAPDYRGVDPSQTGRTVPSRDCASNNGVPRAIA